MPKVELLNPQEVKDITRKHGQFACTCYDTPEKYAEKVGRSCLESGHMSGSRCEYIKFRITADRGTLEQIMRHVIGVDYDSRALLEIPADKMAMNMKSFRYCPMTDFSVHVPPEVFTDAEAYRVYTLTVDHIKAARNELRERLASAGVSKGRATECCAMLLPRAAETELTIGFTVEALAGFMGKRLCTRTQRELREVAYMMRKDLLLVAPQLEKLLVPQCERLLWCPEKHGCGRKPSREAVEQMLRGEVNE